MKNILSETENLISRLTHFLKDKVNFAYVFGSVTGKYFSEESDIDIAVWFKKYPVTIDDIRELKYKTEKSINFLYDIDLVILNNADIIITNQIIETGKIIIDNTPEFTNNFIIAGRNKYIDFKFWRKNLEDNLKTKIL